MGRFVRLIAFLASGRTPEYPDLQPLTMAVAAPQVFTVALSVARTLPRWTVVQAGRASR